MTPLTRAKSGGSSPSNPSSNAAPPGCRASIQVNRFLAREEASDLRLLASLQPGAAHPRDRFQSFRAAQGRPPVSVCIWVGPEGDFTLEEIAAIQSAGALPVTLGPFVLRCETAAVYCLSVINYELL
jgi:16S rRNA (uracil1498-N3)-methyltransferase